VKDQETEVLIDEVDAVQVERRYNNHGSRNIPVDLELLSSNAKVSIFLEYQLPD
jgi:hypothetical protein